MLFSQKKRSVNSLVSEIFEKIMVCTIFECFTAVVVFYYQNIHCQRKQGNMPVTTYSEE